MRYREASGYSAKLAEDGQGEPVFLEFKPGKEEEDGFFCKGRELVRPVIERIRYYKESDLPDQV